MQQHAKTINRFIAAMQAQLKVATKEQLQSAPYKIFLRFNQIMKAPLTAPHHLKKQDALRLAQFMEK